MLNQNESYNDSENVLGTRFMVQPLSSMDGAQGRVDAEQTHAAGVYRALYRVGQPVMLITVRCQNLDNLSIRWCIFRDSDIICWLGEDGSIVIIVHDSYVNLNTTKTKRGTEI